MAEFPALPLFTDAYLSDTRDLSAAQHGAYLLLLMTAWRTPDCALPNDDKKLSRWAAMDLRTWLKMKPSIMQFWRLNDEQKWVQRRLQDERNRVADKRSKNVAAGKSSALKRHKTTSTPVEPEVNQNPTIPEPEPDRELSTSVANSHKPPPKRASRLTEAWIIPNEFIVYARQQGLDETEAITLGDTMRDWSIGNPKGIRTDWPATWRTFVRKFLEDRKNHAPSLRQSRPNVSEQAAALAAKKYGWDEAEPGTVGSDRYLPPAILDA